MKSVRVAVPLFRGKRRFHLEKGRRWSVAEHIILAALVERPRSADELARDGRMHRRLALEMLIRLMRAGWVELRPDGSGTVFQASPAGIAAAGRVELPVVARPMSRWMNFVVDRITGSIFRPREMPFLHRNAVEERAQREPIVWLEPRTVDARFEIQDLVSHLFQEDETFVALDPAGDRLMERFGLVLVRNGSVEGLPERAPAALTDAIRQAAATHRSSDAGRATTPESRAASTAEPALLLARPFTLSADDLIVGARENEDALLALLGDARQRVIIHSTFVSEAAFARLRPNLIAAAQGGARVDLLWGESDDPRSSGRTRAAVSQLRAELARTGEDELIRLHPFSTRSHAKFAIADRQNKAPVALVGSCNWLSSGMQLIEAAVRLHDAAIVADLLFQAAELSCGRDGHWTELTSELAAYAAQLATRARTDVKPSQPFARLVLGPAHKAFVLQAKARAETRIFVTSHRFSIAARQAVLIPLSRSAAIHDEVKGVETRLFYGHEPEANEPDRAAITAGLDMTDLDLKSQLTPSLHAKLLGWDADDVVITSQNWLSADPSDANVRRELGIHLHGPGVGQLVADKLRACFLPAQP
ncbi:MAG: hypothetical protein K2P80_03940 [Beijerinckiaceae bacterium]|nr:hypothetical protein [Beijerinckiaceae bacterium]